MAGRSTHLPDSSRRLEPRPLRKIPRRAERSLPRPPGPRPAARGAAGRRPRLRHGRADPARPRDASARARRSGSTPPRRCSRRRRRTRAAASPSARATSARSPRAGSTSSSRTPRSTGSPTTPRSSRGSPRCSRPGGQLAIQVPANDLHPSHAVAREVAREPAFAARSGASSARRRCSSRRSTRGSSSGSGSRSSASASRCTRTRSPRGRTSSSGSGGRYLTDYEKRLAPPTWDRFLEPLPRAAHGRAPGRAPVPLHLPPAVPVGGASPYLKPPVIAKNPLIFSFVSRSRAAIVRTNVQSRS